MPTALTVGGTRFIGRHTVDELVESGYDVTTFTRGEHPDPFADEGSVSNYRGDRNDRDALEAARDEVDPDVVIDFVGLHPRQVETATEVFADVDAYVYVSSASAYANPMRLPAREGDPLHDCTPEQAEDDSMASYGPRKAECDRVCFAAADDGVAAMAVRPVCVYGPHDYSGRHDYWFDRVAEHDRVLVPGDGTATFHRVYVADLARALVLVAEEGEPGEAYNAAERQTAWLDRTVGLAAEALDTDVERVHASARELARADVAPTDFPLYAPIPVVVAAEKLAALGWESTPVEETVPRSVEEFVESDRRGADAPMDEWGPDRATEEELIEELEG